MLLSGAHPRTEKAQFALEGPKSLKGSSPYLRGSLQAWNERSVALRVALRQCGTLRDLGGQSICGAFICSTYVGPSVWRGSLPVNVGPSVVWMDNGFVGPSSSSVCRALRMAWL